MSLLGSQVFASASKPCWLAADDGIAGDLLVTGNLTINGGFPNSSKLKLGAGLNVQPEIYTPDGLNAYFNCDNQIVFGRLGDSTPTNRTNLQINTSAPNTDVFTVAGSVAAQSATLTGTVSLGNIIGGAGMSGTGSIAIAASNTTIAASQVAAGSKIFLSRVGAASAGPGAGAAQGNLTYRVADIVPGVSFTVYLVDIDGVSIAASNVAATFVWMIVN